MTLITIGSACVPNQDAGHGLVAVPGRASPTIDESSILVHVHAQIVIRTHRSGGGGAVAKATEGVEG